MVDIRNPTRFTVSLACQLIQKAQNEEESEGTRGRGKDTPVGRTLSKDRGETFW